MGKLCLQEQEMKTKHCPHCKQTLPLESFYIRNIEKKTYQSWCTPCKLQYQKENRALIPKKEGPRLMKTMFGEKTPGAKLTNHDVRLIRGLFDWLSDGVIAEKFEVHKSTIQRIRSGRNWSRVR